MPPFHSSSPAFAWGSAARWSGVVVAEMFTALAGLGYMIVLYGNTFRTAELFVPILVLAVISIGDHEPDSSDRT